MTGSIRDYTTNFKFIIPEFNIATWHDYIEQNFRSIDALFHNLFGINEFSGIWKINSQYTAGQVLFVGEDNGSIYEGRLLKVVNDTNTGGFSTFSEAIEANPTDYEFYADASSAQLFSNLAKDWANKTDGTVKTPEGEDTGEYSAKKYAQDSQSSATDSEHFRLLAETDKNIALEAATSAETSAQNSETSAQNALVSEQNSKTSETNAKTSEQNALVSEQNAKSSEDNAKVYETNAANSIETLTNNFNTYNNQLLSTTSLGVTELTNTKTSSVAELDSTLSNALGEINSKTNVLDKTMITNCLTYVPQDILVKLVDGTVTLKESSKVYYADGSSQVITQDVSRSTGNGLSVYVYTKNGNFRDMPVTKCFSGDTQPTSFGNYCIWYDTNSNVLKYTSNAFSSYEECSFPVCLCSTENGVPTSIDQVFNGFGYVGSTFFALPGFECLISRGKLANGIDNYKFVNNKVFTAVLFTKDSTKRTIIAFVKNNELTLNLGTIGLGGANHILANNFIESPVYPKRADNALWFNTNDYKFYFNTRNNVDSPVECLPVIFSLNVTGNKTNTLSFCDFKTTFQASDYNDKSTIMGWSMPDYSARVSLTTSTNNQTVPSRGWLCWQQSYTGNQDFYFYVNDKAIGYGRYNSSGSGGSSIFVPVDYGDVYRVTSTSGANIAFYPTKGV